jgi:hypothetical protein
MRPIAHHREALDSNNWDKFFKASAILEFLNLILYDCSTTDIMAPEINHARRRVALSN